jgi:Carboxypeptidase regulatory-like domain
MSTHLRIGSSRWTARLVLLSSVLLFGGCGAAHGPVLDRGEKPSAIGGTISGIVRAAGSNAPLSSRTVTAIEIASAAKYEVSTATNGGYTLKVPVGRYRLEIDLRAGESIVKAPSELTVNRSDLNAQRNFFIGMNAAAIR